MSPRAAWRLETLGFADVYDYVGSKMDWIAAGLPWEGTDAGEVKLGDLAAPDVAVCALDDTVAAARAALDQQPIGLVVNHQRIVLGLIRADALGPDDGRVVAEVMDEGPSTYRPHVPAAEMAEQLEHHPVAHIVVTTLDGRLVGVTSAADVATAARQQPKR